MRTASLAKEIEYGENRPTMRVMLDTHAGKEIRIVFKKGQVMKKHQAPFPIVVEIFEGNIKFGVNDDRIFDLKRGDLIALDVKVPHDLLAIEDSVVRLSLNKADSSHRVEKVTKG